MKKIPKTTLNIDFTGTVVLYTELISTEQIDRIAQVFNSAISAAIMQTVASVGDFPFALSETDIAVELSQVEHLLPQGRKYIPRKYGQGVFGTLFERLLFAVRNGNIRDQLSLLANLDVFQRTLHRKTGTLVLSRNRFLEAVQHWLESEGLSLDTQVQDSYRRNSRYNSHAKVGTSYHS